MAFSFSNGAAAPKTGASAQTGEELREIQTEVGSLRAKYSDRATDVLSNWAFNL